MADFRRFWVKEPPVIQKPFSPKKRYTFIQFDDFGLRSSVIQKPFSPKKGIP